MYRPITLAFLLVTSLLVGFMAVVQWTLVPAQNHLDASAYTTLEQGMNRVLTTLTPVLMISAIVSGLVVTLLARQQGSPSWWLYAVAVVGLAAMVISTLIINAPVNTAIDTWNPAAPPADWQQQRDRWEAGHALRSYVGFVALTAALVATVWHRPGRATREVG